MGAYDAEIRKYYERNIYGKWRDKEKVTYKVIEVGTVRGEEPERQTSALTRLPLYDDGKDVQITVALPNKKETVITVRLYLPKEEDANKHKDGCPYIICLHPIASKQVALDAGYAVVFMDSVTVASDDMNHTGCFYDLYPYGETEDTQTGVLMAWAWGASKVIDAMNAGLAKQYGISAKDSVVTGVSRWGKATAVCGAFDARVKLTVPVCSGAGGLALWNYNSEGMTYNLKAFGGPEEYTFGQNEPLSSLQSEAERGWFVDKFLEFSRPSQILTEQHYLPVLAAGSERFYMFVAAWMGEDWVNPPGMWECYKKVQKEYIEMNLENHLHAWFHKEGHALLDEDMKELVAFFDKSLLSC